MFVTLGLYGFGSEFFNLREVEWGWITLFRDFIYLFIYLTLLVYICKTIGLEKGPTDNSVSNIPAAFCEIASCHLDRQ